MTTNTLANTTSTSGNDALNKILAVSAVVGGAMVLASIAPYSTPIIAFQGKRVLAQILRW
jgi:hypothetical protein